MLRMMTDEFICVQGQLGWLLVVIKINESMMATVRLPSRQLPLLTDLYTS